MRKIFICFFSLFTCYNHLCAQIFPKEGSEVNYRIIGFSTPLEKNTCKYKIEIAEGNFTNLESFKKNVTGSFYSDTNKILAEVPSFGNEYTWHAIYFANDSTCAMSPLFHFRTGFIKAIDTNANHLRITVHAKKHQESSVFIDALGVLYDMAGQPIWYLPKIDGIDNAEIRDLKISPFGTITFLLNSSIYEINYQGVILWKKENVDSTGIDYRYHHEFSRLTNGHYMVLGTENVLCKYPPLTDSSHLIISDNKVKKKGNEGYIKAPLGTIIEYDEIGRKIWTWRSADYIRSSDLVYSGVATNFINLHDNAFFFDEKNKMVYVSFRDVSRVIKIKYPEGNVLNAYGNKFYAGTKGSHNSHNNGNDFFCQQHACKYSSKGYIYLFNDGCDTSVPPKIVRLQEPKSSKEKLEKIWEYTLDDMHQNSSVSERTGGNVIELPDQSIFASTGNILGKVLIVNLNKEVLWSGISEKWDQNLRKWVTVVSYRASIIPSRKDLEKLIWNSETDNNHVSTKATL